jgi:hypothetical protein
MIRSIHPNDLEKLRRVHELYFAQEFDFPDFMQYLCAFVIEDDKGIITAGGIRDIAECVLVTDMSRKPTDRARALYQVKDAVSSICRGLNYDQVYIWSQQPKYTKRLLKNGFKLPVGQSLILDL